MFTIEQIAACESVRMLRARRPAEQVMPIAGVVACRSNAAPWLNVAGGLDLLQPVSAEDVLALKEFFSGCPFDARVELTDRVRPWLLGELSRAGFLPRQCVAVLARPLDASSHEDPAVLSGGVVIRRLGSQESHLAEQLAALLTGAFTPPDAQPTPQEIAVNTAALCHPESHAYIALDGDVPVGGGLLDIADGVASLWGAAVSPTYRCRGIQRGLFLARMDAARQAGATMAYTETAPGGPTHRNAARLGFTLAYNRIVLSWKPRS
jgi:hypothetical protein